MLLATATLTRSVNVVDTTPPAITLVGDAIVTHEAATTYVDSGVAATDSYDGDLTNAVTAVNGVDSNQTGSYNVSFNVSDAAGNQSTLKRTVNVVDTTPPQSR